MKTVPAVRLVEATDAAALPALPEEIALAMADIAGAAREGLLAMSVAAGMAVMAAMFEAEIAEVCGPKGKHDANRAAVRHGQGRGSVTLGGRRVAVDRPRARTLDGRRPACDVSLVVQQKHGYTVHFEFYTTGGRVVAY